MTGTANTKYYSANGMRTAEKRTGYTDQNGVYWLLSDPDLAQQDSGSTTITAYTAGGKKAELRWGSCGYSRGDFSVAALLRNDTWFPRGVLSRWAGLEPAPTFAA